MKFLLILVLPGLLLAGCQYIEPARTLPVPAATGFDFQAICSMPKGALVASRNGDDSHYLFSIDNKDIGGCLEDKKADSKAPWWERADLVQIGHIDVTKPQIVKFDARFLDGFVGKQESFFQIQNNNPACPAEPSLMIKWHKGDLELSILQDSNVLKPKRFPDTTVKAHRSWSNWQLRLARQSKTTMTIDVSLNGKRIGRGHIAHIAECATPHVRFGIFRPGNAWSENETSMVEFRRFSLKPLYPPKVPEPPEPPTPIAPPPMLNKTIPPPMMLKNEVTPPPMLNRKALPPVADKVTPPPMMNKVKPPLMMDQITPPPMMSKETSPPESNTTSGKPKSLKPE